MWFELSWRGIQRIRKDLNAKDDTAPAPLATADPIGGWRHLPNLLTLSRVPMLFVIAGLLFVELPGSASLAFFLFVLAALTDWADGHLARRLKVISNFGKLMDALTDKVLTTGMFVAFLGAGLLPRWAIFAVLLILAREFVITGLRLVAASHGRVLAAERAGKQKTVAQLVAIHVILAVPVLKDDLRFLAPDWIDLLVPWVSLIGQASFVLAALLTLTSGMSYLMRYGHLFVAMDPAVPPKER